MQHSKTSNETHSEKRESEITTVLVFKVINSRRPRKVERHKEQLAVKIITGNWPRF